jgi:hypothetical protein
LAWGPKLQGVVVEQSVLPLGVSTQTTSLLLSMSFALASGAEKSAPRQDRADTNTTRSGRRPSSLLLDQGDRHGVERVNIPSLSVDRDDPMPRPMKKVRRF